MTVTQYETRFMDLAHHALLLLHTEGERVRRFIEGLTYPINLQMAKETRSEISFQAAANVARRIEMVLAQERGQGSDEMPRQFGGFSGASFGGRGNFGRGHPPRTFHSTLQASYSVPPTPISASLIQGFQGGCSGRQGQFQGQQSQQPRSCYTCGYPRHIARLCLRSKGNM
ncbi:uncharacterized protein [Nicotiana tomentosiformis]|uniref:uncharacterized protein n=1 Tax=Nicotiana tomentosiformis TaxID=4098 RepID=UPI00388C347F